MAILYSAVSSCCFPLGIAPILNEVVLVVVAVVVVAVVVAAVVVAAVQ